ncbi:MAG: pyruvate dehydrogenase complex dihydrolipoamide acetyltransferase [Amoebophilaceae bacterium]|nr:pyruvate dehydrogenase complex dihydrolipoamide acetyltransferase [Amoebophilaceae bacterium]
MVELIRMPKMSDTMQHGIIGRWLKQVGDKVVAGDILAEVETDKATMELESYEDGILLHIGVAEKSAAAINDIIAIIGEEGEDINEFLQEVANPTPLPQAIAPPELPPVEVIPIVTPVVKPYPTHSQAVAITGKKFASPLAKKIAKEKGYSLSNIPATGPHGRIVQKDVLCFTPNTLLYREESGHSAYQPSHQDIPLSTMRKTVASVLTKSKIEIPHFYLTISVHMDKLVALRAQLNVHTETKISINDIVIKAVAHALKENPVINAAWLEDKIRQYDHIHIGVAVAIEGGLVVPTIQFADKKTVIEISKEVKVLHEKAQQKKLIAPDYSGATFTISNLGMFGIESFTAIINPPAACILAVGAMQPKAIVQDQQVMVAQVMKLTLSCDHRVVDGAVGALFLSTLKKWLEEPLALLL